MNNSENYYHCTIIVQPTKGSSKMRYEVRIFLNSISYEVEASDEIEAESRATDILYDENMYDLMAGCIVEVNEIGDTNAV
jgi:hypothetical protein